MAIPWREGEIFSAGDGAGGRGRLSVRGKHAAPPPGAYAMSDAKKPGLTRSRVYLLLFFGFAILLSITTILGTWSEQRDGVVDPSTINSPVAVPATK
jgi:hypothetical protein